MPPKASKQARARARLDAVTQRSRDERLDRILAKVRRGFLYAVLAFPVVLFIACYAVYAWARIDLAPALPSEARTEAIATIRHALDGDTPTRPTSSALARRPRGGPVFVTVWHRAQPLFRHVSGGGQTIADALMAAAEALRTDPGISALSPEDRARARIKIDVTRGAGPIITSIPAAFSLGLVPGVDTLAMSFAGKRHFLMADDMIIGHYLEGHRPFKFIDWYAGLSTEDAVLTLYDRAGVSAESLARTKPHFYRIRTEGFVEAPERGAAALPVLRGNTPAPELTPRRLREAAIAGGRYLLRMLNDRGKFVYEYHTNDGRRSDPVSGGYNMPRHSGTTYFLAQLYRYTRLPEFRAGAERAMQYMGEQTPSSCGVTPAGQPEPPYACVTDAGAPSASMGATALAINALAEFEVATGERTYHDVMLRLGEFVLFMQRPDGSFSHYFDLATRTRDLKTRTMYFDGEAALALARLYEVTGDKKYLAPMEHALDWLTGGSYDYFAGSFFFGEDHWTCIAAEAASRYVKKAQYVDFCEAYGKFLRRAQFAPGEAPGQPDFSGGYGFTPFFPPNNTPVSSRTETMISAWRLSRAHGRAAPDTKRQIWRALEFLTRNQIRPDNTYLLHDGELSQGALMGSTVRRDIRIDYIQHACSAMIRATELFPDPDYVIPAGSPLAPAP